MQNSFLWNEYALVPYIPSSFFIPIDFMLSKLCCEHLILDIHNSNSAKCLQEEVNYQTNEIIVTLMWNGHMEAEVLISY